MLELFQFLLVEFYGLIDKIMTSLATFQVLISLSLNDNSVIDSKEFHKLQTLYLQLLHDQLVQTGSQEICLAKS